MKFYSSCLELFTLQIHIIFYGLSLENLYHNHFSFIAIFRFERFYTRNDHFSENFGLKSYFVLCQNSRTKIFVQWLIRMHWSDERELFEKYERKRQNTLERLLVSKLVSKSLFESRVRNKKFPYKTMFLFVKNAFDFRQTLPFVSLRWFLVLWVALKRADLEK